MLQRKLARLLVLAGAFVLVAVAAAAPLWSGGLTTLLAQGESTGVKLQIIDGRVSDNSPVVVFKLTDDAGSPLKLTDVDANSLRFAIVRLQVDATTGLTQWVNYVTSNVTGRTFTFEGQSRQPALASATQAGYDAGGRFVDRGNGLFSYMFGTALPANFDRNATHRIAGQVTREARKFADNASIDFTPSGVALSAERTVVTRAACEQCHNPIVIHGGTRRDPALCVTCHTAQTIDPETGRTVDFKVLVHKLHFGRNLPSVQAGDPYVIVGNSQNVFNFSTGALPQDVRNCTTCHKGPQGDNFKTNPSAAACTSCHERVNPITGENHLGGPQTDATCKTCHTPNGPEFGLSVEGAHAIPAKSQQLRGVRFAITGVSNTGPGQRPIVTFSIKDKTGNVINPQEMSSLSLTQAWPTSDYTNRITEAARNAQPVGDGTFSFTFPNPLPSNATGTVAMGIEGYIETPVTKFGGKTEAVRDVGFNQVVYSAITDPVALPRKQVVDLNSCNKCHDVLALHGGTRRNAEYCLLCHNPRGDDTTKRTTAGGPQPPESIHFKTLIHKLHTGEELNEKPFIVYGGSPASPGPIDLSEIVFPGDRRDCEKCHRPGSQLLDFLHQGAQPTQVSANGQVVTSIPPITGACTSCHDSGAAKQHAAANTSSTGVESCIVCHGEGRDNAVSVVHRRP